MTVTSPEYRSLTHISSELVHLRPGRVSGDDTMRQSGAARSPPRRCAAPTHVAHVAAPCAELSPTAATCGAAFDLRRSLNMCEWCVRWDWLQRGAAVRYRRAAAASAPRQQSVGQTGWSLVGRPRRAVPIQLCLCRHQRPGRPACP